MDTELQALLNELVEAIGAIAVCIAPTSDGAADELVRVAALGKGAQLVVRFADAPGDDPDVAAAIERAVRAVRACARRWEASDFPALESVAPRERKLDRDRVLDRIESFLMALANAQGVANTAVTVRDGVVACAVDMDELQRERIPFLLKQVEAEGRAQKGRTSHVEIIRDDLCAFGFWIDACLVAFCDGDFSPDFLRHRARMVMREISQLLPHLDDDPTTPVNISPVPD